MKMEKAAKISFSTSQVLLFLLSALLVIAGILLFIEKAGFAIFLGICVVLTTVALVLLNPLLGLFLAVFIEFSGIVWGFAIPFGFFAVVALTMIGWLFDQFARLKFSVVVDSQYFWVLGYIIAILISTFPAFSMQTTLFSFFSFFKLVIFYFLIVQLVQTENDVLNFIKVAIFAVLFSIFLGVVGFFVELPIFGKVEQGFRFRGLTNNPNILALFILIVFPVLFLYFFRTKKFSTRLPLFFLLFVLFLSLLLTFSRGATIAFATVIFSLLIALRKNKVLLLVAAITVLAGIMLVPELFWERIASLKNIYQDPSLRWRAKQFFGALQLFSQHPIFGMGSGNFVLISHQFSGMHLAVHNTFLEVAAETGLLGLFFFLSLVTSHIYRLNFAKKVFENAGNWHMGIVSSGLLISFIGFLVFALFHSTQAYFILWTLFGVGTAIFRIALKSDHDKLEA